MPIRAIVATSSRAIAATTTPLRLTPLLVAYGDSITHSLSASDEAHRWANMVATLSGWDLQNSGVSGTVLQNTVQTTSAPVGGALIDNGYDTLAARVLAYTPDWVAILYGLNDIRFNDAAFSAAEFQSDYGQIIDRIVANGTAVDHILIGSPPYIPVASYAGYSPWDGGSAIKHAAYVAASAAVAAAKGALYVDVYQEMVDNGGDTLIDPDGIHPNNLGHAVIRDAFLSLI